ncbi:Protein arv1 [Ceratocystis fimbriata CBS 114723]|uniref:Protein ARV n=1 Tax=Ceratocystis fimbriata CBS 114723 TaxID=1035309 RepID=A0A2C5X248_9PEZI|nr:Protein arv1 [Ceratocystis fimbriata CBS 114723]
MPICIECSHPVEKLWTHYSATTSSNNGSAKDVLVKPSNDGTGHNIRLTVCRKCGRFCDKYVEHDFVVMFIDMVLIKPQVYRHLLHNTMMGEKDRFDPSIVRLGVMLFLFDVYLTWARIEKRNAVLESSLSVNGMAQFTQQPIVLQYCFFLALCSLSTLAFHMSIRFFTCSAWSPLCLLRIFPRYTRPNSVSTALMVSSSTKLFPMLMVIWDYDVPAAARSLGWALVANNIEALRILLNSGYSVAVALTLAGTLSRWAVSQAVLWAAGMRGLDSLGEGSVADEGRAMWAVVLYAKDWLEKLAVG